MAKYKIIPSSRTIVQSPISIGHKAEKGVEAIEFDVTAWVETYGSGTLTVIMRRWGDAIPYPIALEIDENNKATWTLSDTDTAKAGMAYAQLNYIVGDEVVKKSDIYTFRVMDSLTGEGDPPEAYESWLEHLTRFAAEAMAEVLDIEGIVTDKTLTVDGGIADAKATGEALAEKVDAADYSALSARVGANTIALAEKADRSTTYTKTEVDQMIEDGDGLTDTVKAALMNLVEHIGAWTDGDSQEHIDALHDALYPPVDLVSIDAVYTQTNTIYTTNSLKDLRSDLVVTATYSDNTTSVITAYSLSGTLKVGTSTITVAYANLTTTFTVVVAVYGYSYSYANGDLIKEHTQCGYEDGIGTYYGPNPSSGNRRTFFAPNGEHALLRKVNDSTYENGKFYPISIPIDATSVTISITPNVVNIGPAFHTYDATTGVYTRVGNPGYQQGSGTYTFSAGLYDVLTVTSKTKNGSFDESTEPTELTIVFE